MFDWLFNFPATLWGLALLVAMLLAAIAGQRFHRRVAGRRDQDAQYETQEGYTLTSVVTIRANPDGLRTEAHDMLRP